MLAFQRHRTTGLVTPVSARHLQADMFDELVVYVESDENGLIVVRYGGHGRALVYAYASYQLLAVAVGNDAFWTSCTGLALRSRMEGEIGIHVDLGTAGHFEVPLWPLRNVSSD